ALGRLSDLLDLHPGRRGAELLEVADDLHPVGELAVLADLEAEDGFGRGDVGGGGREDGRRAKRDSQPEGRRAAVKMEQEPSPRSESPKENTSGATRQGPH